MLTKNDLTQIKTVVGDVIDDRLKKELKPINDKLGAHDAKFDQIDKRFDKVEKQLNQHDKQFNKIHKDLKIIINYFDHNSVNHETRITRIEKHLGLASP